jgi:hypothetical protein
MRLCVSLCSLVRTQPRNVVATAPTMAVVGSTWKDRGRCVTGPDGGVKRVVGKAGMQVSVRSTIPHCHARDAGPATLSPGASSGETRYGMDIT